MANLETNFIGMTSPNPFWIASGPPSDKDYNVHRAFEAGWGGVVWKTLGEDPHIGNVNGPRYAVLHGNERQVIGFNNIELITDRPLQTNLKEMTQIKRDWPDRPLIASVMLPMNEASWAKYVPMIEDTGTDAFELNFGCPHGMSERGMGAAVGQVPEYVQMAAEWCKKHASIPVIDKLTPNITHILHPAKAAKAGGADAVSLINTINSIMRVDCDSLTMYPTTDGMGTHGGYCGEAVKPIALNMVAEIARTAETHDIPISGIGGLNNFLDEKGMASVHDLVGKAVPSVTDWKYLNLNYIEKATIDQDLCIKCGKCHIACEDTSHQAITHTVDGERKFVVKDEECVVCNLCVGVCPIENCITMKPMTEGVDPRTGLEVNPEHADWRTHPNNPLKEQEG
jgi:dihydropyrimidine dehydrogenase (NAD+) subunit PreA